METIISSLIVKPKNEPIFSEMATKVSIDDEAAGLFVVIEQHGCNDIGKIAVNPEEWPAIRAAVDRMIAFCEQTDPSESETK